MDWKSIITGLIVGAILGIGSTMFLLNGKISSLQSTVDELKTKSSTQQQVIVKKEPKKYPSWPQSPDGKYQGVLASLGSSGKHYQIKEVGTGRIVMTTNAQYETENDVKAGLFYSDSRKIAAAYHYSHEGQYTWVGIWDIETGNQIDTKRKTGWTTDLYWVFNEDEE